MCEVDDELLLCDDSISDFEERFNRKCVPTQTQIREQLGGKLSDIFFENLTPEGREILGLDPPLVGPDTVWISPEARLQDKVTITPVPEPQSLHLKAFLHKSVLEAGERCIVLLENKHRLEMMEALKNQEEELKIEWKRQMEAGLEYNAEFEAETYQNVIGTLMEHFDSCFEDLAQNTALRMRKECSLKMDEERAEVAAYMYNVLQEEVARRDYELCGDFHDILYGELNALASRYVRQINEEREVAVQLMQETVRKYETQIKELKTEMQLSGMVDICRAINEERAEWNNKMKKFKEEVRDNLSKSAAYIDHLEEKNQTLQKMSTDRLERLMKWREKIKDILVEYQRFINFALKSIPGQAEFLLSMNKLMLKKFPEDSFLLPEDYSRYNKLLENNDVCDLIEEDKSSCKEKLGETEERGQLPLTPPEDLSITRNQSKSECRLQTRDIEYKAVFLKKFSAVNKSTEKTEEKVPKPKQKSSSSSKKALLHKKLSSRNGIGKSSELQELLTLVGENEKEHLAPLDEFLQKRLDTVIQICKDDPEFAKIMLGYIKK